MYCYAIRRDYHGIDTLYRFESDLAREHWFCRNYDRSDFADYQFPVSRQFAKTFIKEKLRYYPDVEWRFDSDNSWHLAAVLGDYQSAPMPF